MIPEDKAREIVTNNVQWVEDGDLHPGWEVQFAALTHEITQALKEEYERGRASVQLPSEEQIKEAAGKYCDSVNSLYYIPFCNGARWGLRWLAERIKEKK